MPPQQVPPESMAMELSSQPSIKCPNFPKLTRGHECLFTAVATSPTWPAHPPRPCQGIPTRNADCFQNPN